MNECRRVSYNRESWFCLTHNELEPKEKEDNADV